MTVVCQEVQVQVLLIMDCQQELSIFIGFILSTKHIIMLLRLPVMARQPHPAHQTPATSLTAFGNECALAVAMGLTHLPLRVLH